MSQHRPQLLKRKESRSRGFKPRSHCGHWVTSQLIIEKVSTRMVVVVVVVAQPVYLSLCTCGSSVTEPKSHSSLLKHLPAPSHTEGAGIAQWLEHRTRDWKVAGSNPCWNGGRIFFSRVDFLCWLLFRYPFHPRVTTVARKKSRSFCQKCRWQVTAKHAYTLRMWILLNRASALVTTCP